MSELSDLAVLVRVKNEAKALPQFLRHLRSQLGYESIDLIFLDSGSTDNTLELLRHIDCTVYQISSADFHFGSSCNLLMSLCNAPKCMFLSGHVILSDSMTFATARAELRSDQRMAAYFRQVPGTLFGSTPYERAYLARRFPAGTKSILLQTPSAFSNAASALTRAAWNAQHFPEVDGSEDFLWAQQHLLTKGVLKYIPQVHVEHSHREPPELVYKRVKLNVDSRTNRRSRLTAARFFLGVLVASMLHGASFREALSFARSHARAYL